MRRIVAALILAGALSACGAEQGPSFSVEESAPASAYGGADMAQQGRAAVAPAPPPSTDADSAGEASATPAEPNQPASGPSPVLYLAYTYNVGFELPSTRVSAVVDRHVAACQAAGPRLCQLIGSNKSGDPQSQMNGYVNLRAEPAWLRTFMAGLANEADEAGGIITNQAVNSEDLTRQIVDTEARVRALTSLRNRLQDVLRSRPGRLADLLEVERELARVQGELDAIQSNLAVMRTRVAMSELTLSYTSQPRSVGSDTFRPLRDAFANFLGIVISGFAAIITIIAGLIPVLVVGIPVIWLLLRWRRARGGRFFARAKPPAPTTES